MTKEEKSVVIKDLTAQLAANHVIYLADLTGLDAKTTSDLRRACFKAGIKLSVVKNTLLAKAMEASDKNFGDLPSTLKGNTSLMFAEVGNAPAKLIQNFRKKSDKPILKGAYIEEAVFIGDNQLDTLSAIIARSTAASKIYGVYLCGPCAQTYAKRSLEREICSKFTHARSGF